MDFHIDSMVDLPSSLIVSHYQRVSVDELGPELEFLCVMHHTTFNPLKKMGQGAEANDM